MGISKFLDAHSRTILTICMIVQTAVLFMNLRLQKRRHEQKAALQEFEDKYKPTPMVGLRSPESDMLHRVFHMCREMIITLRRFEEREDWQMEKGFGFFN